MAGAGDHESAGRESSNEGREEGHYGLENDDDPVVGSEVHGSEELRVKSEELSASRR